MSAGAYLMTGDVFADLIEDCTQNSGSGRIEHEDAHEQSRS